MQETIKWINKHKVKSILILLVFITIPIFLCEIIYRSNIFSKWYINRIAAGELLGYLGDVLSFVGTVVLGFVAIKQNSELRDLTKDQNITNKKMMKLANTANEISMHMLEFEKERSLPLVSFDIENSQISVYENTDSVSLFFRNETNLKIVSYTIELEDNAKIIDRVKKNADHEGWEFIQNYKFSSHSPSEKECNITWDLNLSHGISALFIKVKLFVANGDFRVQYFLINIHCKLFFICEPIFI